jgi:chorismate dehydratase
VQTLVPSALSFAARRGDVDLAPLPIVTCFELEDRFVPLGDFCIATKDKARSIIIFSKRPIEELDGAQVALTGESSTSVRLLKVVFAKRYKIQPKKYVSTQEPNDALILIGDAALRNRKGLPSYKHMYDLGELWHDWTGLPFVFARWVVRREVTGETVGFLSSMLGKSLSIGMTRLDEIAGRRNDVGLTPAEVRKYIEGFNYRLGDGERKAIELFRKYLHELGLGTSVVEEARNAG